MDDLSNLFGNLKLTTTPSLVVTPSKKKNAVKKYADTPNLFQFFNNIEKKSRKGSQCSVKGRNYEELVWEVCVKIGFCTTLANELGGSSSKNDLVCNWNNTIIPIEIKGWAAPDWTQLSIEHKECGIWKAKNSSKISAESILLFENILSNKILFNGKIPPFFEGQLSHDEWKEIKKNTSDFNDMYIDIPDSSIADSYKNKGCYYIQLVGKNNGLYHTGEDICNFNVPKFEIKSRMRIRIKIHSSGNQYNTMKASVMCSFQPENCNTIVKSDWSLHDIQCIPPILMTQIN
jgi:hypothetical protein